MGYQLTRGSDFSGWRRYVVFLLLLVLVLALSAPTPPTTAVVPRAHSAVLALAEAEPGASIGVIVQKAVADKSVELLVARLGGTITRDLSIINAFAAEVPAAAARVLARTPGVRWVSPDARTTTSGGPDGSLSATPSGYAHKAINVTKLWAEGYQGSSVTVAVVDSGIKDHPDLGTRIVGNTETSANTSYVSDFYAHGTHVAGIIGGNGSASKGKYFGIAPKVKLLNVKVSDDQGGATTAEVVAGLQWVLENKDKYNIRVVNLSLNSSLQQSYHVDPLCAAAEILWFNGIVVVVSAGNSGAEALLPPANDPFVITVGATEDTTVTGSVDPGISNDIVSGFSAYGRTVDRIAKPDLVAPGKSIVSTLASSSAVLATKYSANKIDKAGYYFKMSGTSMAAPIVAGAVALLLQDEPALTPDQVKYRLMATAVKDTKRWPGYTAAKAGAGYLDVYAAVYGTTTESANTGLQISSILTTGDPPMTTETTWSSANWSSANWSSANWSSANWSSANWSSANWSSTYWGK